MASVCISSCVNDARVPVRATYVNLYKWPESDKEFVRSMSSNVRRDAHNNKVMYGHPRVVESLSCRQIYLRSYTFSRDEDHKDDEERSALKCLGRSKVANNMIKKKSSGGRSGGGGGFGRCSAAFRDIFRRLLSCTTKIDVVN